jgi:hypothetical protein
MRVHKSNKFGGNNCILKQGRGLSYCMDNFWYFNDTQVKLSTILRT